MTTTESIDKVKNEQGDCRHKTDGKRQVLSNVSTKNDTHVEDGKCGTNEIRSSGQTSEDNEVGNTPTEEEEEVIGKRLFKYQVTKGEQTW